jgi:hypothetical protein
MRSLLFAFLMSCVVACGGGGNDVADAAPDANAPTVELVTFPARPKRKLDLLVVDDDSASMVEEQRNLARDFPRVLEALRSLDGGLPSLHIGIVSTDVGAGVPGDSTCKGSGDDGKLLVGAACGPSLTPASTFIQIDGEAQGDATNLTGGAGTLSDTFSCMALLGDKGCGFEQPLEAMKRALSPGKNPGFLRADAVLAVLFLSDEDDCSTTNPDKIFATDPSVLGPRVSFRCFEYGVTCDQTGRGFGMRTHCAPEATGAYLSHPDGYAQFLKDLKGTGTADDDDVVVAGILGNATPVAVDKDPDNAKRAALAPSCGARSTGTATPAIRTQRFLSRFPGRSSQASICQDDYASSMSQIGDALRDAMGNPCIAGELLDQDPGTPGLEPDCEVADVVDPRGPQRSATPIASCAATHGVTPCWKVTADSRRCAQTTSHLRLDVQRSGEPPTAQVEARCKLR